MARLTLRTLLAYMDDTLPPADASALGKKVAESDDAKELVEKIKRVTRRRRITTPDAGGAGDDTTDPNTVAAYLDNALDSETVKGVERTCLESDPHLAEVAACHQILTLVLTEPVRVPPRAHRRMYALVPGPAGDPERQPNKALPIGGAAPPAADAPDAEGADAALLFGLKRYSAAASWGERLALFGVAAVLLLLLVAGAAVLLSRESVRPPEAGFGPAPGAVAPVVPPVPPVVPDPKPREPDPLPLPPKPDDPKPGPVAPMPKEKEPPVPLDPVAAPDNAPNTAVAKLEAAARGEPAPVLLLAQRKDGWERVRAKGDEDEAVLAGEPVLALPGFKAAVLAGTRGPQAEVLLWGNLPDQVPARVFEARATFHVPPPGFAADLTLHAGRAYLKARGAGAKVRVRAGGETWDIALPDARAEVLVELVSWFEPGAAYAPKDGPRPRLDGRVAVAAGTATVDAPARFKRFGEVPARSTVAWDSVSGKAFDPRPVPPDDPLFRAPAADPALQKELAALAAEFRPGSSARVVLESRLARPGATREATGRAVPFALAALADAGAGAPLLGSLVDLLGSETPWATEHALVTALVAFVGRDAAHTAALRGVLVPKLRGDGAAADRFLGLLRGFVSPFDPDPARLAQLVEKASGALVEDPEPLVRDAAFWNLLAVDQGAWLPRGTDLKGADARRAVEEARKRLDALRTNPPKK